MTKFEQIGAELQNESRSRFEAVAQFRHSCRICCMRNMPIQCERCAIRNAHDLNVSILAELEAKRREGIQIEINFLSPT